MAERCVRRVWRCRRVVESGVGFRASGIGKDERDEPESRNPIPETRETMPTYEYKCQACGHQFEKFQSMSAAPIRRCPKCNKNQVRRLIGMGAGLIFKGSGFYITDYRDAGYKEKAKAESGEPKKDATPSKSDESKA